MSLVSTTLDAASATPLEQRINRRLTARGERGLAARLRMLDDIVVAGRYQLDSVYAVGGEGVVYDCTDLNAPDGPPLVAKLSLLPLHRPLQLESDEIRRRRYGLRVESQYLLANSSPFMPAGVGLFEFVNPLLDETRGDAFAELEPVLIMEKLPGRDLDRWLARTHRTNVPRAVMRRTLDRVAVVLVQALTDLRRRNLLYADLRPANMRMLGRPDRRVRMLDAGSLVAVHDRSGRFPHVPAYLPPELFERHRRGERILPSDEAQAVMVGRTLFEVATGRVPRPGEPVDVDLLPESNVSPPVADMIAALCEGRFPDVAAALRFLKANASRRVENGNDPRTDSGNYDRDVEAERARGTWATRVDAPATPATPDRRQAAPTRALASLWRRIVGRLLGH